MSNIEKKIRGIFKYEIGYDEEGANPLFFKMNKDAVEELILHLTEEIDVHKK